MLSLFLTPSLCWSKSIKISRISDLEFGTSAAGDSAKTIAAGTSENASNASFEVTGDKNRAFTIALPATATITKGTQDSITISSFTSYPSGTSSLDSNGDRIVYLGATRAALRINQVTGSYSGTFTMTVVY